MSVILNEDEINALLSFNDKLPEKPEDNNIDNMLKEINSIKLLPFSVKKFINIKNQKSYTLLSSEIINTSNKDNGMIMVLYTDGENLYVRDLSEFGIKFQECE